MFQKNDIITVTITDQGTTGEGIGKVDGYALFVKDAIVGDTVQVKIMKAKKNYAFARLMEIVTPSPNRVAPPCPVARSCGGCQLQAMNYAEQLRFKERKVCNNLKRIGGLEDFAMRPIMGMDGCEENVPEVAADSKDVGAKDGALFLQEETQAGFFYRNKAQFPVGRNKDGKIVYGFYAGRTHSIIEMDSCMLGLRLDGRDVNRQVMETIRTFMELQGIAPYDETTGKGLVRHVLIRLGKATGQVMVCIVINGRRLPKSELLVEKLREIEGMTDISLSINRERSNVIMGTEIVRLYGPGYIEDLIGDVKFRISPLSFFQVNPTQTKKLYDKALEYAGLTGNETVWDLYCGIGSISLFLARRAKKVLGVEIIPDAIADAKVNAQINGIENAEFLVGAAEDVVPQYFAEHPGAAECQPDVIVVDPPRKGCDEKLLKTMALMAPERIVYVSCDSATLARDVKWLGEHGYAVKEVTPCDQFGMTVHVEVVAWLQRGQKAE